MKLSKKWIVGICLVLLVALVIIGQYVICFAPSPKPIGYEDAIQLLQQTEQLESGPADIWKSKDGKFIFNATVDIKNVKESESKGVYIGDNSIQKIKVLIYTNRIQVIGENNGIIFEGYGKYDRTTGIINVRCEKNYANLLSYDSAGDKWVDFCLLKKGVFNPLF